MIVGGALLFRAILLPTDMILELDLYRYSWDGAVLAQGENPYRYSPQQVLAASQSPGMPEDLKKLVELRDADEGVAEALSRIHYEHLPTCYPPVSVAAFAAAHWVTPAAAPIELRVAILKSVIGLFDLATVLALWVILRTLNRHSGWLVSYAWCPLILKEFANSGHLDSIAVFFSVAAVAFVVRVVVNQRPNGALLLGASVAMALAIGAKLYPVVLLPVMVAALAAKSSVRSAMFFAACSSTLSGLLLAGMLLTEPAEFEDANQGSGLQAFLTQWEMNDFLFMIAYENLRPEVPESGRPSIWFAVVPNGWRKALIAPVAAALDTDTKTAAFLVTRFLTGSLLVVIALAIARSVYRRPEEPLLLEGVFLTLAWFWLLAPTQNPWYWSWALPFLPFARSRAWWAMSGLVLAYYLRFYFRYFFPEQTILGTAYNGPQFFDFVVTWLEFGPWFVWLAITASWRSNRQTHRSSTE